MAIVLVGLAAYMYLYNCTTTQTTENKGKKQHVLLAELYTGSVSGSESGLSSQGSHVSSLLVAAAEKGDTRTVRLVLNSTHADPDKKTRYQQRSALHLACGYGQRDVVEQLLQVEFYCYYFDLLHCW